MFFPLKETVHRSHHIGVMEPCHFHLYASRWLGRLTQLFHRGVPHESNTFQELNNSLPKPIAGFFLKHGVSGPRNKTRERADIGIRLTIFLVQSYLIHMPRDKLVLFTVQNKNRLGESAPEF